MFLPQMQRGLLQDSSTKAVLPGVSVYNKSHSTFTQTDLKGTFDSGLFDDKDLIIFRLMGYELLSISKQNIQSDTLYLTPKVEGLNEIVVSASKFGTWWFASQMGSLRLEGEICPRFLHVSQHL